jgi:hypothetical protein
MKNTLAYCSTFIILVKVGMPTLVEHLIAFNSKLASPANIRVLLKNSNGKHASLQQWGSNGTGKKILYFMPTVIFKLVLVLGNCDTTQGKRFHS